MCALTVTVSNVLSADGTCESSDVSGSFVLVPRAVCVGVYGAWVPPHDSLRTRLDADGDRVLGAIRDGDASGDEDGANDASTLGFDDDPTTTSSDIAMLQQQMQNNDAMMNHAK